MPTSKCGLSILDSSKFASFQAIGNRGYTDKAPLRGLLPRASFPGSAWERVKRVKLA
jgi:hypothetical protein